MKQVVGIIPAGAGLTGSRLVTSATARDHPRGCGAHQFADDNLRHIAGSSPRVRGSH